MSDYKTTTIIVLSIAFWFSEFININLFYRNSINAQPQFLYSDRYNAEYL